MERSNTILNTVVLYFSNKMLLYNVQPKKKKNVCCLTVSLKMIWLLLSSLCIMNSKSVPYFFVDAHVASPTRVPTIRHWSPRLIADPWC